MHLLRCEDYFFSSFLPHWLQTNHVSPWYQDTTLYCMDKMIKTNRLVVGLIFPELGGVEQFGGTVAIEVILADLKTDEVKARIKDVLVGQGSDNSINNEKVEQFIDYEDNNAEININTDDIECGGSDLLHHKKERTIDMQEQKYDILNHEIEIDLKNANTSNHCEEIVKNHCNEVPIEEDKFIFKCEYCPWKTITKTNLERHVHKHTRTVQFECEKCGRKLKGLGRIERHKNSHNNTNIVKCNHCNKKLKSDYHLERHMKIKHTIKSEKFMCDICSTVLKTKEYLRRHQQKVHTGYNFMCSACEKKFKTKANLTEHEKLHGEDISTDCHICGFKMRNVKKNVKSHMKTHFKVDSLKCDKCEYHFRTQSFLLKHDEIMHQ